jgi:hypothetical protein
LPYLNEKFKEPVFVFTHILAPHPPWVFDSNGDLPLKIVTENTKDVKKRQTAYLNQTEFINKKVIETTQKLISESNDEPIIIILSDHGSRIDDNTTKDQGKIIRFGNFMAFYLPNNIETSVYETSPVNVFRLIFNSYFNGNYEILENKVFSGELEEFEDWEKKVNNVFG